jgi:hypothetical protein
MLSDPGTAQAEAYLAQVGSVRLVIKIAVHQPEIATLAVSKRDGAQVVYRCSAPVEVRASGLGGRGVFATQSLQAQDIIWKERPLVGLW